MLSNKATVPDWGRSMCLHSVSVWQSFCLGTSHGTTSPTGMVPFYLDCMCPCMRTTGFSLAIRSGSTRAHITEPWLCILKTQTSQANTPLCRYGGILSVQIESTITALVQEGAKNATQIWDMRACSCSHVGRVTYLPRGFEMQHILMREKQRSKCIMNECRL